MTRILGSVPPCGNCTERNPGDDTTPNCHTTCPKYLEFVADNQAKRQKYKQSLPPVLGSGSWNSERGFQKSWNHHKKR